MEVPQNRSDMIPSPCTRDQAGSSVLYGLQPPEYVFSTYLWTWAKIIFGLASTIFVFRYNVKSRLWRHWACRPSFKTPIESLEFLLYLGRNVRCNHFPFWSSRICTSSKRRHHRHQNSTPSLGGIEQAVFENVKGVAEMSPYTRESSRYRVLIYFCI